MSKYLRKFETSAAYDAAKDTLDKPNVSYIVETNGVAFNPYVPPQPIRYTASAKLAETTSEKNSGLHTNAFNTTIKSHTFENGVGTIEFNDDVTTIGDYAFYGCSGLTSVTIPNSVTSIRNYAFQNCSGLTSVTIPNSVTRIGGSAFYYCSSLTSIVIPDSVTSIGNSAFRNCSGLARLNSDVDGLFNIPNSVTSISDSAFSGCSGLISITIPSSVTSIGYGVFSGCSGLTNITIPNSVTSIGQYAFEGCSGLTSVTIGSGVTRIDGSAFNNCTGLTNITSNATTAPSIASSTFKNVKTGGTLYVPSGSSGYNTWMYTSEYHLGYYNWTKVEQ